MGKDFPIGTTQLEVKTTAPSGVAFKINGTSHPTSGVNAVGETKYSDRKRGVTLTQSWSTNSALNTVVELDNNLVSGLKLDLNATLLPGYVLGEKVQASSKNVLLNAAYKTPGLHTRANLNLFKVCFPFPIAPSSNPSFHSRRQLASGKIAFPLRDATI